MESNKIIWKNKQTIAEFLKEVNKYEEKIKNKATNATNSFRMSMPEEVAKKLIERFSDYEYNAEIKIIKTYHFKNSITALVEVSEKDI